MQPGQGWGCSVDEQGLQKGEGKGKVKNSTPRMLTEMQRTDLNKNNEETKLIHEQMAWPGSPCVKSAFMNAGNDMCLGQEKPHCFGNTGIWEE